VHLFLALALTVADLHAQTHPAPPEPAHPVPVTITADGVAWELARAGGTVRLLATDEEGHTRTVARWTADSPTAPVACAPVVGGRVALARPAGARFRVTLRDETGAELWLPLTLPARPDLFVAHPDLPFLLVRMPRPDGTARAWWVDLETLRIAGRAAVPAGPATVVPHEGEGAAASVSTPQVRFGPGPAAWLDDILFEMPSVPARRVPAAYPFDAP
jgi:hypothetical protein